MRTQLRAWAEGVTFASVLMAVAVVPLFVNYASQSVFELDKTALILVLALVAAVAGTVALAESGATGLAVRLRHPMVLATAILAVGWLVATAFSPQPRLSILGSYERGQGLLHFASLLVMFGASGAIAQSTSGRRLVLGVAAAASLPVAFLALAQRLGAELVEGNVARAGRAFGTLSNPIFLGAYLMPLTLVALGLAWSAWRARRPGVAGGWAAVAGMGFVGVVASDSRGPLAGLALGLLVLLTIGGISAGRRRLALTGTAAAVAGILVLIAMNLPSRPLGPMESVPGIGRFATITRTAEGSQRSRLAIWNSSLRLAAAEPLRLTIGQGPEFLKYRLLRHAEPAAPGQGEAGHVADRAHNVLLDALLMTGFAGAVGLVALLAAWFWSAAAAAGFAGRVPLVGAGVGLVIGLASGLAWPAATAALLLIGAAVGAWLGLMVAGWRRPPDRVDTTALALVAVAVALAVEWAFGIKTAVPALVFWVLAGVVLTLTPETSDAVGHLAQPAKAASAGAGEGIVLSFSWNSPAAAVGIVMALCAGTAAYAISVVPAERVLVDAWPVTILLMGLCLLAGAIVVADAGGVGSYLLGAVTAGVIAITAVRIPDSPDGAHANLLTVLMVGTLTAGMLLAAQSAKRIVRGPIAMVYAPIAVLGVVVGLVYGVRPVQADMQFHRAASAFGVALRADDQAAFQAAQGAYAEAVRLNPNQPFYPARWAEAYATLGGAAADTEAMAAALSQAQSYLATAEALEPQMPYHAYNRARLQLMFADRLPADQRARVAADAVAALGTAFGGAPTDPAVGKDLALAQLLAGNPLGAVNMVDYVRTLTPNDPDLPLIRGQALQAMGDVAGAKAAYEEALATPGVEGRTRLYVALAEMARQDDNPIEALRLYELAAAEEPDDWTLAFNLGLLYRDTARPQEALTWLSRALGTAPPHERQRVQDAIDQLITGSPAP